MLQPEEKDWKLKIDLKNDLCTVFEAEKNVFFLRKRSKTDLVHLLKEYIGTANVSGLAWEFYSKKWFIFQFFDLFFRI